MALGSDFLALQREVLARTDAFPLRHAGVVPLRQRVAPAHRASAGPPRNARVEPKKLSESRGSTAESRWVRVQSSHRPTSAATVYRMSNDQAGPADDDDVEEGPQEQGGPLGPDLELDEEAFSWAASLVDGESQVLAAVDLGTNSFHMVVVKADASGNFQIQDVEKEDVRLGSGSAGFSVITPEAEDRAVAAIRRLKKIADLRGATMRIVATSAVREARNRRAFVRRIHDAAGVDVEVLSGREEARLIYLGILQAMPVYHRTVLTVDIGGGSTEFVIGRRGNPLLATSLKLGHIRLTERFAPGGAVHKGEIEEMRRYIQVMLADSGVVEAVKSMRGDIELAIGSSGTIETIEQMCNAGQEGQQGGNGGGNGKGNGGNGNGGGRRWRLGC